MTISWQKAFVRDAKTKVWHKVRMTDAPPVQAACGARFSNDRGPGKARLYDLTSTWPGLAKKRCGRCMKAKPGVAS